jgi:hypothetical protein
MIDDVWEWTSSGYVLYPGFESRFSEHADKLAVLPLPHDRSEIATENILDHKGESFFQDSVVNRIYNNSEYFWLITVCSAATLSLEMNDNNVLERRFIQIQVGMMSGKIYLLS